jgi:hypothetical protein
MLLTFVCYHYNAYAIYTWSPHTTVQQGASGHARAALFALNTCYCYIYNVHILLHTSCPHLTAPCKVNGTVSTCSCHEVHFCSLSTQVDYGRIEWP